MSPIVDSKSVADRFLADRSNVHPKLNGDVTLIPTNQYENWAFTEIDESGDPDGLEVALPDQPTGFWVYFSEVNKGPETMAAQNTAPIPLTQPSYTASQSWVGGHRPVSKQFAADIAAPPQPTIQSVSSGLAGFPAGLWYLVYAWVDALGRMTTTSPTVSVAITAGQSILVDLPQDAPPGAVGISLFLGTSPSALYHQEYIPIGVVGYLQWVLSGPFTYSLLAPSFNQTVEYKPRPPEVELTRGERELEGIQTVSGRAVEVSDADVTDPSDFTEEITTTAYGTDKVAIAVSPGKSRREKQALASVRSEEDTRPADTSTGNHRIYLTTTVTEGTVGVVQQVVNTENQVSDTSKGSPSRGVRKSETVKTRGRTKQSADHGETGVYYSSSYYNYSSPSSSGTKSVPAPQRPVANAVAIATQVLAPGNYWVAISYDVNGEETVTSTPQKITVSAGQMPRIVFPNPVSAILNPTFSERDSAGKPFDHTLTPGVGSATATIAGEILLDTLASITGASVSPSHRTVFPVNRSQDYWIAGEIVSVVTTGTQTVVLEEYDGANATGTLLASTTLSTISASGVSYYSKYFGPVGDSTTTQWNAATVSARVTHQFAPSGGTRQGSMLIYNLYYVYGRARPRKAIPPPAKYRQPATTDPSRFTAFAAGGFKVTAAPPAASASTAITSLAKATFDGGSKPTDWTFSSGGTGTTDVVQTGSAIDGAYGWHVAKTSTATRYQYGYKDFTPSTRTTLGLRAKFRVNAFPTSGYDLMFINTGTTANLCAVYIGTDGTLGYTVWQNSWFGTTSNSYTFGTSSVGDILDIEVVVAGGNSTAGQVQILLGKNRAARTVVSSKTGISWSGFYPNRAYVGPSFSSSPSGTYDFDLDSWTVTNNGDSADVAGRPAPLTPYTLPDRPLKAPTILTPEVTYETGALPTGWATSKTPNDSTTTATVQTASAISGTYGLRISDTGTATLSSVYTSYSSWVNRSTVGARARYRIVTRPTTGVVWLMWLTSTTGANLAVTYIDSAGDVWTQPYSAGVTTGLSATKVATGITNGTIITLEMVGSGAGSTSGRISTWFQTGGDGSAANRDLMYQDQGFDWSSGLFASPRLGGLESVVGATYSFDLDNLLLTDQGETQWDDTTAAGKTIQQVQYYLPAGSPSRDDIGPRDLREAVIPGQSYTVAVKCRYRGIATTAKPFFWSAYDLNGNAYELGSILGSAGVSGTNGWADYTRTFTIPSADNGLTDCLEVRMDSRGINEGEWVFQSLSCSPGTSAIREVTYPSTGNLRVTLDTKSVQESNYFAPGRIWLDRGVITEEPAGTSASVLFQSAPAQIGPFTPPGGTSDVANLTPNRIAYFDTTLSTTDPTRTPTIKSGTPFVEYGLIWSGAQVATLTREDRSELYGGILIADMDIPFMMPWESVRNLPSGRTKLMRMGEPVGTIDYMLFQAFTEEAARELSENWYKPYWVETRDKIYRIQFTGPLFSTPVPQTWDRISVGNWRVWAEFETQAPAEIIEFADRPV